MTIMGKVAYTVLVAFIASVLTLLAVNWLAPNDDGPGSAVVQPSPTRAASSDVTPGSGQSPIASPSADAGSPATTAPSTTASDGGITLTQVATHNSASSCWIAIDGIVYDVTTYLSSHPADPEVLLAWCGQEATQAWEDKGGIDESHTARAEAQLEQYEIGTLSP